MFGVKLSKRDMMDLNLCVIVAGMMLLGILVRVEIVWKPAVVGASAMIAAVAAVSWKDVRRKYRGKRPKITTVPVVSLEDIKQKSGTTQPVYLD